MMITEILSYVIAGFGVVCLFTWVAGLMVITNWVFKNGRGV